MGARRQTLMCHFGSLEIWFPMKKFKVRTPNPINWSILNRSVPKTSQNDEAPRRTRGFYGRSHGLAVLSLCMGARRLAHVILKIRNCVLTRAPLGGGKFYPSPLPDFRDNSKTEKDSDAKLSVPTCLGMNSTCFDKFWAESVGNFWVSDVLVTSCQAISGQKTTKFQTAVEPWVLKQISNKKSQ